MYRTLTVTYNFSTNYCLVKPVEATTHKQSEDSQPTAVLQSITFDTSEGVLGFSTMHHQAGLMKMDRISRSYVTINLRHWKYHHVQGGKDHDVFPQFNSPKMLISA